jgi:hypothetical protein
MGRSCSWVAAQLAASQEGLSSVLLLNFIQLWSGKQFLTDRWTKSPTPYNASSIIIRIKLSLLLRLELRAGLWAIQTLCNCDDREISKNKNEAAMAYFKILTQQWTGIPLHTAGNVDQKEWFGWTSLSSDFEWANCICPMNPVVLCLCAARILTSQWDILHLHLLTVFSMKTLHSRVVDILQAVNKKKGNAIPVTGRGGP